MAFLVIFWLGLGNPRHIATKSQQNPNKLSFGQFWKKVGIGSTPPVLGPNSQFLPKICFESFPNCIGQHKKIQFRESETLVEAFVWKLIWLFKEVRCWSPKKGLKGSKRNSCETDSCFWKQALSHISRVQSVLYAPTQPIQAIQAIQATQPLQAI